MRLGRLRHPILSYRRAQVLPRWVRRLDRSANRRVNAWTAGHRGDVSLRRLTRAADRSRLWFLIAAGLVLLGRPRAALRGILSLTVASAAANLVGKRLFGGPRPVWKDVPVGRQLSAYPTSASFPSGHSASAAAFAAGVAAESPAAGAVVGPLAAAVAYSRVHVGAHWASDVAGGIAIGAGIAALGALVVPPRRGAPGDTSVASTGPRVALPKVEDGAGVLIVMNAQAGTSVVRADPRPVFDELLPSARVAEMSEDRPLDVVVGEALDSADPPRVLGVYGGDGSVSRMAHLAQEHSLPMLALPGGTFNHFVRAAGVDEVETGIDAARNGLGRSVGIGALQVDDAEPVTVLNTVSLGIYPELVAEREKHQERWGKWVAGVIAAAVVLRRAEPIDLDVDGERMRVWSLFVSIGRNEPGRVSTMQRRSLTADVLDMRILHARGSRVRAFGSLAFGHRSAAVLRALRLLPRDADVERRVVEEATLTVRSPAQSPVVYVHDGEIEDAPEGGADRYEMTVTARPDALRVYAP